MPKTDARKMSGVQVYTMHYVHNTDWRAKYKNLDPELKALFSSIAKQINTGEVAKTKPAPKAIKKAEKDVSLDGLLSTAVKERKRTKRGPLKNTAYGMYAKAVRGRMKESGEKIAAEDIRAQWASEGEKVKAKFQRRADHANVIIEKNLEEENKDEESEKE